MSDYSPLPEEMRSAKPATAATIKANSAVLDALDFSNRQSFEDASKGFIASLPEVIIPHDNGGRNAYDLEALSFLDDEAPDTVNPSLWRQAQLNAQHHGLFEVVDGIYQVRSFDIANMTLIRGETGWIIIDPLTCAETS
ncbi:MAG: MBL fold metallo-hydrolase, partial [Pseudomonadales bacterium]